MGKGLCLGLVLLLAFGLGEGELEVVKRTSLSCQDGL